MLKLEKSDSLRIERYLTIFIMHQLTVLYNISEINKIKVMKECS